MWAFKPIQKKWIEKKIEKWKQNKTKKQREKSEKGIWPVFITLDKPQFIQPSDYTVDVVEGEPAVINMTAQSNPPVVTYAWSRDGTAIRSGDAATFSDRILANGSLLNVAVIRRDDAGDFNCEATNSEGTQSATVRLNVQCTVATSPLTLNTFTNQNIISLETFFFSLKRCLSR